ncbi:DUF2379 family protein [Corallococcus coralloides]|uniref:DUF2379 family protein n=1 Tax=Corallococcus coralloides TaxID=184914 RepID=UPI00384EC1EE
MALTETLKVRNESEETFAMKASALGLLREESRAHPRRLHELMDAPHVLEQGSGDSDGARQGMQEALAAGVTPHHRAIAQVPLNELADEP